MKFKTPSEESLFCAMLSAFVEEFGAENIVVIVPRAWTKTIDTRMLCSYSSRVMG